jgi:hypothetical protein
MSDFETFIRPRILPETDGLALEVIAGPYRGVIYSYTSLDVLDDPKDGELARVQFKTMIHEPAHFIADAAFDEFCADILISWIELLSQADVRDQFSALLKATTSGVH